MAGVKGRSGGPRKNSGGKRPGAGRKPKHANPAKPAPRKRKATPEPSAAEEAAIASRLPPGPDAPPPSEEPGNGLGVIDAKEFLEGVMSGRILADEARLKAAQYLLPFQHKKLGETGKKEQAKLDAGKVAGRFAAAPPPRAMAVHGKRVQ